MATVKNGKITFEDIAEVIGVRQNKCPGCELRGNCPIPTSEKATNFARLRHMVVGEPNEFEEPEPLPDDFIVRFAACKPTIEGHPVER